jgi:hypothetical protein
VYQASQILHVEDDTKSEDMETQAARVIEATKRRERGRVRNH